MFFVCIVILSQATITGMNVTSTILVTGGAGYIGAHVTRQLLAAGYKVVVIDDLSTGQQANVAPEAIFIAGSCGDLELLAKVFREHSISTVMHFAASIEVGESTEKPLEYFENNVVNTQRLITAMLAAGVRQFVFSSTAAVYGLQQDMPIKESASIDPLDPYGTSKFIAEEVIRYHARFAGLQAVIFRYFNAAGSDFEKPIYSTHNSHLIPRVLAAQQGQLSELEIYGNDYETPDGTGVRDYVHVLDIARAHLAALELLPTLTSLELFNIGTSKGLSVKEIIEAAERLFGKPVPHKYSPRRAGDSPITVADNSKISSQLNFELKYSDIDTILKTSSKV